MKSSVYKLSQGVYVADLEGRKIMRGGIVDLAAALLIMGVTIDDLLWGDWREGAELLSQAEKSELRVAMSRDRGFVASTGTVSVG